MNVWGAVYMKFSACQFVCLSACGHWTLLLNQFYHILLFSGQSHVIKDVMTSHLHRGSNMSTHVLLNLINELRKRDKMRGFPSLINSIIQEHEC